VRVSPKSLRHAIVAETSLKPLRHSSWLSVGQEVATSLHFLKVGLLLLFIICILALRLQQQLKPGTVQEFSLHHRLLRLQTMAEKRIEGIQLPDSDLLCSTPSRKSIKHQMSFCTSHLLRHNQQLRFITYNQ